MADGDFDRLVEIVAAQNDGNPHLGRNKEHVRLRLDVGPGSLMLHLEANSRLGLRGFFSGMAQQGGSPESDSLDDLAGRLIDEIIERGISMNPSGFVEHPEKRD